MSLSPFGFRSIPPIAVARRLVGCIANENADADCDERGGVGVVLDELLQEVMPLNRGVFDRLSTLRGGVCGLAVGVLHGAGRLIQHPLRFGLGVARNFPDIFLHFAANRENGSSNLVIRHGSSSTFWITTNEGTDAKFP